MMLRRKEALTTVFTKSKKNTQVVAMPEDTFIRWRFRHTPAKTNGLINHENEKISYIHSQHKQGSLSIYRLADPIFYPVCGA
jgi:hypothetical protein